MHKLSVKAVSVTLILTMALSAAACGKKESGNGKSRSGVTITADSPWFNTKIFHFDPELDGSKKSQQNVSASVGN